MRQTQRQALLLSKSRIKYAHIQFHAMPSVRFWCLSPHLHRRKMSKISNRQGKSFNHPVTLIQSLYFRVATISLMSTLNSKHSGIQCPPSPYAVTSSVAGTRTTTSLNISQLHNHCPPYAAISSLNISQLHIHRPLKP